MLILTGCKNTSVTHCPNLSDAGKSHSFLWFALHSKSHQKTITKAVNSKPSLSDSTCLLASTEDLPIKIKLPNTLAQKLGDEKDLLELNRFIGQYKHSSVKLQKDENGKLYLKAHNVKDILALGKSLGSPRGDNSDGVVHDDANRNLDARLSMILGAVGVGLLILPTLALATYGLCIAAIVFAKRGMNSANHKMAVKGLILGIVGLVVPVIFFAILMILVFTVGL